MDGPIPMSFGLSGLFKKKQKIPSWKGVGIKRVDIGGVRGKSGAVNMIKIHVWNSQRINKNYSIKII